MPALAAAVSVRHFFFLGGGGEGVSATHQAAEVDVLRFSLALALRESVTRALEARQFTSNPCKPTAAATHAPKHT